MLAVNKAEGMKYTSVAADFYELGMGDPYAISSTHGDGVRELVDEALDLAVQERPELAEEMPASTASRSPSSGARTSASPRSSTR
jgi:GTP-binding protein